MHKLSKHVFVIRKQWFQLPQVFLLGSLLILLAACSGSTVSNRQIQVTVSPTRHPTVAVSAFHDPITYVALGASDAVGVGSDKPGSQGYVPLIAANLPKGSHTLNLGVSGIHLHSALSQELPLALSTAPQLVTIWLVANDFVGDVSYQSYINDLDYLLNQLQSKTNARVVIANLPDLTRLPAFLGQTPTQKAQTLQTIEQWNRGIAQVAARYHDALLNLFQNGSEITTHPEYISGDGFHPSAQGYVRLAQLFWQVIQGA